MIRSAEGDKGDAESADRLDRVPNTIDGSFVFQTTGSVMPAPGALAILRLARLPI